MNIRLSLSTLCLLLLGVGAAVAEELAAPYPRVSEEGYKARLPFFHYDATLPLEGRVVREWNENGTVRQRIVFRGAQGFLVPGYFERPTHVDGPYPLVLLVHGWSGNKESYYTPDNYISGQELREALLAAGYATLAIDAPTHGERSNEIDYQHVNAFNDPNAPTRRNYFTMAEIVIQTIKDWRRALDYMAERGDVDMERIGWAGYSMGGYEAFLMLALEPRLKMAVACVPPLVHGDGQGTEPVDYTWGIGGKPLLMCMGTQDGFYTPAKANATYKAYIEGPDTKILWYDQGHKLTPIYVPDALAWVKKYL